MTTAVIVQARMGSARLSGKVMAPVLGRPLLSYLIERLQRVQRADVVVIATTTNRADDPIAELAAANGCVVTRGSENDVLARYWQAAQAVGADTIVRVTADCPLIDPAVIDEGIRQFGIADADYVTPLGLADGMNFEVFGARPLEVVAWEYWEPEAREHVTWAMYQHPERFRLKGWEADTRSAERWTVDTAEDLELVRMIIAALYPTNPGFTTEDIAAVLAANPRWRQINAHVEQRLAQENSALHRYLRNVA